MRTSVVITYLTLILLVVLGSKSFSQDLSATEYTYKNISDWHAVVDQLSANIEQQANVTDSFLDNSEATLADYTDRAESCVDYLESNIEKITAELAILGESPGQDTAIVANARNDLEKENVRHQRKIASCRLLLVKTEKIDIWLATQKYKKETQRRLYQSLTLLDIVKHMGEIKILSSMGHVFAAIEFGTAHFSNQVWLFWIVGLLATIVGFAWLYKTRPYFFSTEPKGHITHRTFHNFFTNNHVLLVFLGVAVYCWLYILAWSLVSHIDVYALNVSFVFAQSALFLCITNAIFSGRQNAGFFVASPKHSLAAIRRHTRLLIIFISTLFLLRAIPADYQKNQIAEDLLRLVFLSAFVHSFAKVIWHISTHAAIRAIRPLKYLVPPVALASSIALLAGYYNLVEFFSATATVSYFAILGGYFIYRILTDFLDSLDEGRYEWQRHLKTTLDIPSAEIMPGVIWLRIFVVIITFSGVGIFLFNEWTPSTITTEKLLQYISSGVEVGQITIVPMQIFQALIFIAIAMSILLWTRKQFELRVLSKSRMDLGAQDALGSILMYGLGFLTILIAISIAGVNLGNIAIIAGALSVGIGFGLQAIVNNFVSGLILLLERPIQKGDWIVVGSTEGYVKRISVRSTLIQTFDHADVIVPNSDLITHVVKNWTLKNYGGRISVPVGVSYDCDVDKAKAILLDIAHNRSELRNDPFLPQPSVLLVNFGDNSVDLELRFFVKNINDNLSITSDVRFEILRRFKEEGIVIPFPQRVVHTAD